MARHLSENDSQRLGSALYPMPVTLCLLFSSFLLAVALRRLFLEEGADTLLLLVCAGMVVFVGLWVLLVRLIESHPARFGVRLTKMAMLAALLVQLLVVWGLQVTSLLDLSWIVKQCEQCLSVGVATFDIKSYFGLYPNNVPLCIIIYWLARGARYLGVTDILIVGGLANVAMLQVAYHAFFATLRLYTDDRSASCTTLFLLMNPLFYVYASYFYTDTMSLGPLLLGTYCAARCLRGEKSLRFALFAGLSGVMFALAYLIRATSIFLPAGLFVVLVARRDWKTLGQAVVPFLVGGALLVAGERCIYAHHMPYDTTDSAAPITHWLMLGANGETNGRYSRSEILFTLGFPTHQEKVDATTRVFLERVRGRSLPQNIELVAHKEAWTWAGWDKSYHLSTYDVRRQGLVWELVHGGLSAPLHLYMRIYNVALIASLVLSLALALRLRSDGISILCMFWLFGVVFFALWESHDRYSISFFFPLTMLLAPMFVRGCPALFPRRPR
jgi:hypothetical protein